MTKFNFLFGLLVAAVVGLAAFILWLRDRHRDRVGMSQDARKQAEKKLSRGVQLVYLVGEVAAAFGLIGSTFRRSTRARDVFSVAFVVLILWFEWKKWMKRGRRGVEEGTGEGSPKATSKENWKPPGMPPPIG